MDKEELTELIEKGEDSFTEFKEEKELLRLWQTTRSIYYFDNRLEIMSPGKLPNSVTLENIKLGVHSERNQLIVSYLAKMGYMTQIGTGIPRMIRLLKEHTGKEPDFEEREQEFIVRIWRPDL